MGHRVATQGIPPGVRPRDAQCHLNHDWYKIGSHGFVFRWRLVGWYRDANVTTEMVEDEIAAAKVKLQNELDASAKYAEERKKIKDSRAKGETK